MTLDQKVDRPGDPPPLSELPHISRSHVGAMEATDSDEAWVIGGMRHVVLRTVGRRSGREHKVALPIWLDPEGVWVVVASFAGADRHPAWFLNLADRTANPAVLVRAQHEAYWSDAEPFEAGPSATGSGPSCWRIAAGTRSTRREPPAPSPSCGCP